MSPAPPPFPSYIVGRSANLVETMTTALCVAPTNLPVLVLGESGTGKELLARAIHAASGCAAGPLVPVNCAALPRELADSELFGHDRGAFTGAAGARAGWFGAANGGTLVLDEIGELPLDLQPKLLRVLESGRYCRVGSRREAETQVRIVAMTNQDLAAQSASGRFRLDLYHRLAGLVVTMPPLRERTEDIGPLATHFLTQVAAEIPTLGSAQDANAAVLSDDALSILIAHTWPGNVRELRNLVRRLAVLHGLTLGPSAIADALGRSGQTRVLRAADKPDGDDAKQGLSPPSIISLAGRTWHEIQRATFLHALHKTGGSRRKAAASLGISRSTFCDQVRRLNLV